MIGTEMRTGTEGLPDEAVKHTIPCLGVAPDIERRASALGMAVLYPVTGAIVIGDYHAESWDDARGYLSMLEE